MRIVKRIINRAKRLLGHSIQNESNDPLKRLEEKGFKIAESSKKWMYSPWGMDQTFPWLIEIGEDCGISTNVVILSHDASSAFTNGYTKLGRVRIGNHVFVGQGTTILCGVSIGDNVIIGANSLISKDIPPNSVYAGNPAKYICSFAEFREKRAKEMEYAPILEHDWVFWSQEASDEEKEKVKACLAETKIGFFKSQVDAPS